MSFQKSKPVACIALALSPTVVLLDDKSHQPHLHVEETDLVAPLLGQTWSSVMTFSARSFEDDGWWATELIRQATHRNRTEGYLPLSITSRTGFADTL
jgi:hypothetical protein